MDVRRIPKEKRGLATRNQSGAVTTGRFTALRRMLGQGALGGYLPALGGYLLLSLLVLAPLLPHFGSMIPGGPVAAVDGWQNVWNLWWVQQALTSGTNPFHTDHLYYPDGVDLHLQTLNISNGLLVFPITALFGPIAGYNTALLLAFVLAGLGGYALALQVSGHRLAAFVGGAAFAFSPFHMTKVWDGQLELIALQWPAFYALFLLRTVELRRRREALLAGVFLALIGYTSWYYLLFFAIYSLLFVALWLVTLPGRRTRWTALTRTALVPLVGGLLLLPILIPAFVDAQMLHTDIDPDNPLDSKLIHSANIFDFWLPSYLHPLWGNAIKHLGEIWHPFIAGWNISIGYSTLALAVIGSIATWRTAWRWWVLILTAFILSLGPLLHIGTSRTTFYLPYALLLNLPGGGIANRPSHIVVIATLLFAPLVALGLRSLLKCDNRTRYSLSGIVLVGLLVFEYAPPAWSLHRLTFHPYYTMLAGDKGAVLDLPLRNESSGPLQAQMVHGLPILDGFVSRPPSSSLANLIPSLWEMQPVNTQLLGLSPEETLEALSFYDVRHVVVHWKLIDPAKRIGMETVLAQMLSGINPSYTDNELSVYRLSHMQIQPFSYFGAGWYPEEHAGKRFWRWMKHRGEIVLVNPTTQSVPVTVYLHAESYLKQRDVDLILDQQALGQWQVMASPNESLILLQLLLSPGEHHLQLQAPTDQERVSDSERELSIVLVNVQVHWF